MPARALDEIQVKGINALIIYLGNFGLEGPLSMLVNRQQNETLERHKVMDTLVLAPAPWEK